MSIRFFSISPITSKQGKAAQARQEIHTTAAAGDFAAHLRLLIDNFVCRIEGCREKSRTTEGARSMERIDSLVRR
jgi:hypothetical protein